MFLAIIIGFFKGGTLPLSPTDPDLSFIFTNNLKVWLELILGGFTFGILTGWLLFLNGLMIGIAFKSGAVENKLSMMVYGTLPHGIPEMAGLLIAGAVGFKIALYLIDYLKGGSLSSRTWKELLPLVIFSLILILIAALIETFISPLVLNT